MKRHLGYAACVAGLLLLAAAPASVPWTFDSVAAFERVPVQDGGRVKPLATYARFTLLRFSGRTTLNAGDATLSPTEWLLDCLFRPGRAIEYRTFLVDSPEVMDALGLPYERKRDRYSYYDLVPGRATLHELAIRYSGTAPALRSPVERQVLRLAQSVTEFERLTHVLDFARTRYPVAGLSAFEGRSRATFLELLDRAPALAPGTTPPSELNALNALMADLELAANEGQALALVPPVRPGDSVWLTPAEALPIVLSQDPEASGQTKLIRLLGEMTVAAQDAERFDALAKAYAAELAGFPYVRSLRDRLGLEVLYYDLRVAGLPLFYAAARWLFVLAFLAAALSWIRPRGRGRVGLVSAMVVAATAVVAAGIFMRCVIRMRPPVTTLYETILFITAVTVVAALAAEWVTRRRVALSLAPILGALGLFLADKHEAIEGVDTMPSLVAVLDTNFWLSTHVTTIAIGYAAGLLAAAIAHVFVAAKLLGLYRDDPAFFRSLTRTVYGVVCFGLLFSTVGTVLGGIWASESWGRFWGWDPKENGALLIVIWGLLIVHARLGGFIGDYGVNLAALVGGMVVAFSWWGVNLLNVGLHSYGFTNGAFTGLVAFYGIETVVLLAGFAAWLWEELLPAPVGSVRGQEQG